MLGLRVLVPGAAGCVSVWGGTVREVEMEIGLGGMDVAIVVAMVRS